jgi:biopolymer transport protein ExbB
MCFAIIDLIRGADILIYPLGVCSVVLVFILCERGFALRKNAVLPDVLVDAVLNGTPLPEKGKSVMGRIITFAEEHPEDEGATRAFARLELAGMERGLPFLDVIYAGAPLIGLTGTVWSLIRVFSSISGETGLPDPVKFTSGVSLALSATVIGLVIAVPALVGNGILQRLIDKYAARIDVLLEHVLTRPKGEN